MHATVTAAKTYREQERQRRNHNILKKQAQGLMIAFGLNPAFTPCVNPEGTHRERNIKALPQKRADRFAKNFTFFFYNLGFLGKM